MADAAAPRPGYSANIARATLAAALLVLLAGPLHRYDIMRWQAALGLFVMAALLSGIGAIWCLVQLLRRRGGTVTVVAAAVGFAAVAAALALAVAGSDKPPINDISTDTSNPPAFAAINDDVRGPDVTPIDYNPAFAPQQARAYPDIRPLDLPVPRPQVFELALAACEKDWQIIASDRASGRIEAVARVAWWGFRDDVVIRLTATPAGTRIDVRSKSRVGEGDLGVNARRIAAYLDRLAVLMRKAGT